MRHAHGAAQVRNCDDVLGIQHGLRGVSPCAHVSGRTR